MSNQMQSAYNSTPSAVAMTATFLDDALYKLILFITSRILTSILAICGMIANILNTRVYWKMGFGLTSNISFFALSISDFCFTCLLFYACLTQNYEVSNEVQRMSPAAVSFLLNPLFWATQACGSWITALINIERCCCVVIPLKVCVLW